MPYRIVSYRLYLVVSCWRRFRSKLSFFERSDPSDRQTRLHRAKLGRYPGSWSRDDRCLPMDDYSPERSAHQSHALPLRYSADLYITLQVRPCRFLTIRSCVKGRSHRMRCFTVRCGTLCRTATRRIRCERIFTQSILSFNLSVCPILAC